MAVRKADKPIHRHSCQGAHEELASCSVGAAYQHHLRVERCEKRLRILHPGENRLGPYEGVGDHCI